MVKVERAAAAAASSREQQLAGQARQEDEPSESAGESSSSHIIVALSVLEDLIRAARQREALEQMQGCACHSEIPSEHNAAWFEAWILQQPLWTGGDELTAVTAVTAHRRKIREPLPIWARGDARIRCLAPSPTASSASSRSLESLATSRRPASGPNAAGARPARAGSRPGASDRTGVGAGAEQEPPPSEHAGGSRAAAGSGGRFCPVRHQRATSAPSGRHPQGGALMAAAPSGQASAPSLGPGSGAPPEAKEASRAQHIRGHAAQGLGASTSSRSGLSPHTA